MSARATTSERRYVIPCWPEDSVAAASITPGGVGTGGGGRPTTAFGYSVAGIAARAQVKPSSAWAALGKAAARCPFTVIAYIVRARRKDLARAGFTPAQIAAAILLLQALAKLDEARA